MQPRRGLELYATAFATLWRALRGLLDCESISAVLEKGKERRMMEVGMEYSLAGACAQGENVARSFLSAAAKVQFHAGSGLCAGSQ